MIKSQQPQRSFGDGFIVAEIGDLRGPWMTHVDAILADDAILSTIDQALAQRQCRATATDETTESEKTIACDCPRESRVLLRFRLRGEPERLHSIGILSFDDEFREDVSWGGIQEKFRQALA